MREWTTDSSFIGKTVLALGAAVQALRFQGGTRWLYGIGDVEASSSLERPSGITVDDTEIGQLEVVSMSLLLNFTEKREHFPTNFLDADPA